MTAEALAPRRNIDRDACPKHDAPPAPDRRLAPRCDAWRLSFIHLRREQVESAQEMLSALGKLDPEGKVGWPVMAKLRERIAV